MKSKRLALLLLLCASAFPSSSSGQAGQADSVKWDFTTDLNFYAFEGGDKLFLPMFKANRDWLHLEARYNYEDLETASLWAGYNWVGNASKLEFVVTPMVGGVFGNTQGFVAGVEATLLIGKFEFYTENEYLWDSAGKDYNFAYSWTDISFSPKDWMWFGISAQRTRLYQTDLELQRGFLLGFGAGQWTMTGYLYNWGMGETFGLLTVELEF